MAPSIRRPAPRRARAPRSAPGAARQVVMVAFPDAQILDVTGPLEVFSMASQALAQRGSADGGYRIALAARRSGPVRCSSGLELVADTAFDRLRGPIDTLVVAGGEGTRAAVADGALVAWIARAGARSRRVAGVCTGAFLLARAGLLDGRRATTHWNSAETLARAFPAVRVEADPIWVRDGNVYTSAGVTAGMDLALALVEEDHGREVALAVARRLVLFLKRPGGQSQFSTQLAGQLCDRAPLRDLQAWIADHPAADLSVGALARRVAMSPRHFARVFAREMGVTPARYVERARVEVARRRLEESGLGVEGVAAESGFGSAETMRRAFLRNLSVNPVEYRSRFLSSASTAGAREAR
jgi:transcriptional regulator GlxA family with amidase domain